MNTNACNYITIQHTTITIQYLDANGVNAVGQIWDTCGGGQRARVVGRDVVTEALLRRRIGQGNEERHTAINQIR